ncbi:SDR family oxidoreductase [Sinomonas terrae]|uniref:NAD(P)H-binding protein n=1 Tax=Sinomonas terrae TaxID=2908838 RepID=A0ABS9TVM4_9MICC|nr:NAD(P)H-binding protein [Sinomonas terrae]MCH6468483.1 NAD(P)H-binding protein [Sinomonas terrae]
MAQPVLVTGGTGTLGRQVVARLREVGQPVRVLSRRAGGADDGDEHVSGDLATGVGIEAAVDGVHAVVHCAGTQKGDGDKARRLVRAASAAGVAHLVFISVVGADAIPVVSRIDRAAFAYFASKRDAERVVENSGIPWTTLRATQFYDLTLLTVRAMAKLPVIPVPRGFRFQPVDSAEVADRLVELALGSPAGLVPDLAGPAVYSMQDLIGSYLEATGQRRALLPFPMPGGAARAIRAGANLAPSHGTGQRTWEDFLASAVGGTTYSGSHGPRRSRGGRS